MAIDRLSASKHVERRSCATQNAYIIATCDTTIVKSGSGHGFRCCFPWYWLTVWYTVRYQQKQRNLTKTYIPLTIRAPFHSSQCRQCPVLQSIFHTWKLLGIPVLNGMTQPTKLLSKTITKESKEYESMCTSRLLDLSISTHLIVAIAGILMRTKSLIPTFII